MSDEFPDLTPRQLTAFKAIQSANLDRERMKDARFAMRFTMGAFAVVLVALIFAAFSPTAGPSMRWAFGIIEALLALGLRPIYAVLFPAPSKSTTSNKQK